MNQRGAELQLTVWGRPMAAGLVPLGTFARAAASLTEFLGQLGVDRPRPVDVSWFVRELGGETTTIAIASAPMDEEHQRAAREIVQAAIEGVDALEHDAAPTSLSFAAIEKAWRLASLTDNRAGSIELRGAGRRVALTPVAAARARALLERRLRSRGSVEGIVETISVHDSRPSFVIAHALDGYPIACRCDEDLLRQARTAFGMRVRVTGEILRRVDGRAEAVEADGLVVVRDRAELPQAHDVRGILVTNGSGGAPTRHA